MHTHSSGTPAAHTQPQKRQKSKKIDKFHYFSPAIAPQPQCEVSEHLGAQLFAMAKTALQRVEI